MWHLIIVITAEIVNWIARDTWPAVVSRGRCYHGRWMVGVKGEPSLNGLTEQAPVGATVGRDKFEERKVDGALKEVAVIQEQEIVRADVRMWIEGFWQTFWNDDVVYNGGTVGGDVGGGGVGQSYERKLE